MSCREMERGQDLGGGRAARQSAAIASGLVAKDPSEWEGKVYIISL
jgi:hypothetical protein